MVPDLNPGHFIISQLADLIGDHLIAGAMVISQVGPEQLLRVPESFLGLKEGFSFYEVKSGHLVSFLYTPYIRSDTLKNKRGYCMAGLRPVHNLSP